MATKLTKHIWGGLKIPTIGVGTWRTNNIKEMENTLHAAIDCGFRYFDTAFDNYNEYLLGRVLGKWMSAKKLEREEVFVATKLPMCGLHEERVGMFMRKSLDNLKLDYVNLYMIQFPVGTNIVNTGNPLKLDMSDHLAVWRELESLVESGKTKAIGLCNFNQRQIMRILKCCRVKPACLQVELHVFMQQKELVNLCAKNNIQMIAFAPLGRPYSKFFNTVGTESKLLYRQFDHPAITAIATSVQKTPEQVMLRYLMSKGIIPIPMCYSPSKAKEHFEVFDFQLNKLDTETLDNLDLGDGGRLIDSSFFPEPIRRAPEFPFPETSEASAQAVN